MHGTDVPPREPIVATADWRRSASRILERGWRCVLVLGAADRGKSSYCRFLAARLCAAGESVALVDADIGQKDVGPPATVTLVRLDADSGAPQGVAALHFVGAVNPRGHFLSLVIGTARMAGAAQSDFVVVDTDGMVRGGGSMLRAFQIEALRPQAVVLLERDRELEPIARAHRHHNLLRLRSPARAAAKSPATRRRLRRRAFRHYLQGARAIELPAADLVFQAAPIFNGPPLADARFLYAERTPQGLVGVARDPGAVEAPGVRVLPAGFERGRLCGLADRHGDGLGIAILEAIDFGRGSVTLYTPVARRRIRVLQLGDLRVDREGSESAL